MHQSMVKLPLVHGAISVHVLATPVVLAVEELAAVLVAARHVQDAMPRLRIVAKVTGIAVGHHLVFELERALAVALVAYKLSFVPPDERRAKHVLALPLHCVPVHAPRVDVAV